MMVVPLGLATLFTVLQQQWDEASSTMAMKDVAMTMPARVDPAPVAIEQDGNEKAGEKEEEGAGEFKIGQRLKPIRLNGSTPTHPRMLPTRNRTKANTVSRMVATPRVWHGLLVGGVELGGPPLTASRAFMRQMRRAAKMPARRELIKAITTRAVVAPPNVAAFWYRGQVGGMYVVYPLNVSGGMVSDESEQVVNDVMPEVGEAAAAE
jgi:hypothetical protein